jgi:hypothetical protein
MTTQFYLTPSAGKRLIAKAVLLLPEVKKALTEGTVVVIMGTTNAYIANEVLKRACSEDRIAFKEFHRGISLPPSYVRQPANMRGDLVVEKGVPSFTAELDAACAKLKESDVIFKGANAVNLELNQAGVLIGARETFGTAGIALKSKAKVKSALWLTPASAITKTSPFSATGIPHISTGFFEVDNPSSLSIDTLV